MKIKPFLPSFVSGLLPIILRVLQGGRSREVKLQRNSQFVLPKSGRGLLREVDSYERLQLQITERQNGALRSGRS